MAATPVIAVVDVGKTNKKLFLFDEQYRIVYEQSDRFEETKDEDGDPCEDVERLKSFVLNAVQDVLSKPEFDVKAINFSTYGASFVYVDEQGEVIAPLYNYLKPYPAELQKQFYDTYGGEAQFSFETASPVLGHLNSGLQLYRIKHQKPELYNRIKYALHLPQYLCFLISGQAFSDITSIGCHTNLWNFEKNDYHEWVFKEGIADKLAPITPADTAIRIDSNLLVGTGLHDSSAALIPYQVSFDEPFVLISTGTWCITLNPFNQTPLSVSELQHDCLLYMHYKGKPVKASRLFAGNSHEQQVARLAAHFKVADDNYKTINYNATLIRKLRQKFSTEVPADTQAFINQSTFASRNLDEFATYEEAYHQLIIDIVCQQKFSTELAIRGTQIKHIFVDGGFSKNPIYMNLLAEAFPEQQVSAASMAQATSLGTALAIHQSWTEQAVVPPNLIELKNFDR